MRDDTAGRKEDGLTAAPVWEAAQAYAMSAPARFHTPGHKGSSEAPCAGITPVYDLTELPQTDSLYDAEGVILEAERLAALTFRMKETLFSAGGATLCIQAMLRLVSQGGKRRIVMARNIHRSAVNAAALLGLEPIWVWPQGFEGSSLPGEITACDIESALKTNPGSAAVYLTSPDYYGVISDIASISKVCGAYNVPLLVDNAHGAHLLCIDGGSWHPARLGASMTCDSAHKTLPVLTGGAWLQIAEGFERREAKAAMALFGSTSPSYPVMLSLDLARRWMKEEGERAFRALRERIEYLDSVCAGLGYFKADATFDPVRVTLDTASVGIEGDKAAGMFRKAGISPEMNDDRYVVLLPSPFNSEEDFAGLLKAIRDLPRGEAIPLKRPQRPEKPEPAMTLREAIEAPDEYVEISGSAGRTASECRCPCPPGIPLVMPGERISENLAAILKNYGVKHIKVIK